MSLISSSAAGPAAALSSSRIDPVPTVEAPRLSGVFDPGHFTQLVSSKLEAAAVHVPHFRLSNDRALFETLASELRQLAVNVDISFSELEDSRIPRIVRENALAYLEQAMVAGCAQETNNFAIIARRKGDNLGVRWTTHRLRSEEPSTLHVYDGGAQSAGLIIASAYEAVASDIRVRRDHYLKQKSDELPTLAASGLVGHLALSPVELLESAPNQIRQALKTLMTGGSPEAVASAEAQILRFNGYDQDSVTRCLRYSVLNGNLSVLNFYARNFPAHIAEFCSFMSALTRPSGVSLAIAEAASLNAIIANPSLFEGAHSVTAYITPTGLRAAARYWLEDSDRCASLDDSVRTLCVEVISSGEAEADLQTLKSVARDYPEFRDIARHQVRRWNETHEVGVLSLLGEAMSAFWARLPSLGGVISRRDNR
jgi:hypothetical protein